MKPVREKTLQIGCVADDFTGASDAASFLQKAGLRTMLVDGSRLQVDILEYGPDAIVVPLKTRSIPPEEAVGQTVAAARRLLKLGAQQLYFKYCSTFDSTPVGNIGPVTDALLELLDAPFTVLCPSLPVNGRTVEDGTLYVNGVPLAESPMRNHPVNPMTKSSLKELMEEQSRYPCVVLTRPVLYGDTPMDRIFGSGRCTAVPPYTTDADGARIAEVFGTLPLLTGGSGLLEHLGRRDVVSDQRREPLPAVQKDGHPRLLLAGSCSAMTIKQVQTYLCHGGKAVRIVPEQLLSGAQTETDLCRQIRETQEDLLVYSTADADQVKQAQNAAGAENVSKLLETLMGKLAVCGRDCGITRMIVAGGETSGAVAQALNLNAYWIGRNAAPGAPELWPVDHHGPCLILKSGNFGAESFFLTAMLPESM
jgi:Uncharacterized protein conserved in bacteria